MNFIVINKDGSKIECQIEELIYNEETDISYIIYSDGTKSDNDKLKIYASRYKEEDGKFVLEDIEDEKEWDYLDNYLASL